MTKFKKLTIVKRMFAMALAATMAFSLSSVQLFAKENADVQVMQDGISVYSVDETQGGGQTGSNQSEPDSSNQDETGSADNKQQVKQQLPLQRTAQQQLQPPRIRLLQLRQQSRSLWEQSLQKVFMNIR